MSIRIHAIQTGTVRVKEFQISGARHNLSRFYQLLFTQKWCEWLPIYSWLVELDDRLILIDTGETEEIYTDGYLPKGGLYHKAVQTRIKEEEEIPHQLKSLGFNTKDIDTVILTHLHGDHIGGNKYFPEARFLVSKAEYDVTTSKKGPGSGYFTKNWPEWFKPDIVDYNDGPEGNFSKSHRLDNKEQIIIVPTPGHSIGHQSVIINDGEQSYFIGGDITCNTETLKAQIPNVILSNKDSINSLKKAYDYVQSHNCIFLSAHDWNVPRIIDEKLPYDQVS